MGRRWGKTLAAVHELFKRAIQKKGVYWWVAPTYFLTNKGFKIFEAVIPRQFISKTLNTYPKSFVLLNGSIVEFLSADNPKSLVGEGVSGLVVDEAARVDREAWERALRPALTDMKGWVIFASTPYGRNWFHEIFLRGQLEDFPAWESFTFPSSENPYLDKDEIADARREIPEDYFRQEFLAEFLEDGSGVFRGITACISGEYAEPTSTETYTMGVDLARVADFTVITVLDSQSHLVEFQRFNQIDWVYQKQKIVEIAKKYNAVSLIDATGVGDPIVEDLQKQIHAIGYKFTNESKKSLIMNLSLAIQEKKITFPNELTLINELKVYGFEMTAAGHIRYNAPSGFHDDCVISLALAKYQRDSYIPIIHGGIEMSSRVYG